MRKRRKPLPNKIDSLNIRSLSHEGRGIAHIEGKTTFVHNALPEENVEFEYRYLTSSYNEGIASRIINPSPERVAAKCPHYTLCGGCQLQHMSLDLQLSYKQNMLIEQLAHFGQVKAKEILPPLSGKQWGYRCKARLGVRFVEKKGQRVLVGFRERNGRFLTDMSQCPILHPSIGNKILDLSALIEKLSCRESIPQIEIAVGNDKAAIILRNMADFSEQDRLHLENFYHQHQIEIYSQANPPQAIKKLFPDDNYERLSYFLPKYHLEMRFHPNDFTQINEEMNQRMIEQALKLLNLKKTDRVLDLFCGIGNFTLAMATEAYSVVGVEGSEKAVERAKENALHNQLNNTEFHVADLSQDCSNMPWHKQKYDKILLDPSRAGAENIIASLDRLEADTLVYVSCNPATLSRDAGLLVNQLGYDLESVGIINMFPHTAHIESMALFKKRVK